MSKIISRLLTDRNSRESYVRAKLNVLIPSQIKALRLNREWTQGELAEQADMKQARISAMEKPGKVAFSLETLIRLASAFRVGLQVRFVPYSEMVKWDNDYSQDTFTAVPIEKDKAFVNPALVQFNTNIEPTGYFYASVTGLITTTPKKVDPSSFVVATSNPSDEFRMIA